MINKFIKKKYEYYILSLEEISKRKEIIINRELIKKAQRIIIH